MAPPLPAMMRAVRLHAPGGPEGLRIEEIATPEPGPADVVVRVHAAAITRDELEWPVDRLPATPSYELSGVVAAAGERVADPVIGAQVYGLTGFDRDGVAAEYATAPADYLAPLPRTLGHVESASIPLAALTARQGLFDHGALRAGERVLIHGATGGVGQFATQLARRAGGEVIATTSAANLARARQLGAQEAIDHATASLEDVIEPVDLVFDTAGGARLAAAPRMLKPGGRLVSVADEPPPADTERRIEPIYFVVEPNRDQLLELGAAAEAGELRSEIDSVFELEDARAAFERSLATDKRGKVVIRVAPD
jgi:NADPH:quinone reductase-like Zn-dependent oxidoreductase